MAEQPQFDARLKEGVEYFEQMLKVMPDDRTTLEFLAVVYPQMGETEKAERAVAELTRVLLAEGDLESAIALLPRLEASSAPEARIMAIRVKAAEAPRPELVPESAAAESPAVLAFRRAVESEAKLAEKLGEPEIAAHLRDLPENGRVFLVSALSTLEKEKPDVCERAAARLADEYGEVPIPLEAFEPDRRLVALLDRDLVRRRGIVPFAKLGNTALVVTLSPHDTDLAKAIRLSLGCPVRFYLAEPRLVEAALVKLFPEEAEKN